MQNIEDLKEILTTVQEIGNAWHEENISLREENDRLLKENENLRAENESLRRELENLPAQVKELLGILRDDIINELDAKTHVLRDDIIGELDAKTRDDFQKFVRDYLKDIRDKLNTPTKAEEPTNTNDFLFFQEKKSNPYD